MTPPQRPSYDGTNAAELISYALNPSVRTGDPRLTDKARALGQLIVGGSFDGLEEKYHFNVRQSSYRPETVHALSEMSGVPRQVIERMRDVAASNGKR